VSRAEDTVNANLDHIRRWHDALLSGRYQQTTGALENKRGNCCLGVACREAIADGVPIRVDVRNWHVQFDGHQSYLSSATAAWLGTDEDPTLTCVHGDVRNEAASLNDRGHTFDQIADDIRATWPQAFTDEWEVAP
jgi:hypothetical protein